jgi:hypothetical protein
VYPGIGGRRNRAGSRRAALSDQSLFETPVTISFQNNFTNQFNAQNFSVRTPFHSFLVLKLGATDYLPGHIFLLDRF